MPCLAPLAIIRRFDSCQAASLTGVILEGLKDSRALAVCKRVVLWLWSAELWLRRLFSPAWRNRHWKLAGECVRCGACCAEPAIHAAFPVWHLRAVRMPFLAWQTWVNGLEYAGEEPSTHDLVFRCTHFDPSTKRCDSYASRPSMCRDYPTALLAQPWPELFESCGYRLVARKPDRLRASIEGTSLSPAAKAELLRKLRLE